MMYQFTATTVALIVACFFGVAGFADDIEVRDEFLVVELTQREAFAFGGMVFSGWESEYVIAHEHGHLIQEQALGWGYLVVAVPSLLNRWTTLDLWFQERWADELGGIQ